MLRKICAAALLVCLIPAVAAATRIKDIAAFDGVRENQIIGYGLVVGLNGTGDGDQTKFPVQSLVNTLEKMGLTVNRADITVKNIAAVMITADLPPFAKQGTRLDVLVSSAGDAKSLAGGTLLMTPLKGADGQVYALAQGPVLTNSFSYGGQAASVQKNHPTAGRISSGALVEREVPNVLAGKTQLRLNLSQPDFTTAARIAAAINGAFKEPVAQPSDAGSIAVNVPEAFRSRMVDFIASIEPLDVRPDLPARVVLNERTGTIVMGENVRINTVAVAHGNLSLIIKETAKVSQPSPFSKTGETKVVPDTTIKVTEEGGKGLAVMNEGANIGDVVRALNALGVTPRDLIGIMQAIKSAGALQADLVVI